MGQITPAISLQESLVRSLTSIYPKHCNSELLHLAADTGRGIYLGPSLNELHYTIWCNTKWCNGELHNSPATRQLSAVRDGNLERSVISVEVRYV